MSILSLTTSQSACIARCSIILIRNMPGENCSVINCNTCRNAKNKGVGIFKLPSARFYKEWRAKWLNELTK